MDCIYSQKSFNICNKCYNNLYYEPNDDINHCHFCKCSLHDDPCLFISDVLCKNCNKFKCYDHSEDAYDNYLKCCYCFNYCYICNKKFDDHYIDNQYYTCFEKCPKCSNSLFISKDLQFYCKNCHCNLCDSELFISKDLQFYCNN